MMKIKVMKLASVRLLPGPLRGFDYRQAARLPEPRTSGTIPPARSRRACKIAAPAKQRAPQASKSLQIMVYAKYGQTMPITGTHNALQRQNMSYLDALTQLDGAVDGKLKELCGSLGVAAHCGVEEFVPASHARFVGAHEDFAP
jgi:hypothetical protein